LLLGPPRPFTVPAALEIILFIGLAFAPFVALHVFLRVRESRDKLRPAITPLTEPAIAGKWLSLRHEADEAIEGLRSLPRVQFQIFSRELIARTAASFAVVLAPALLLTTIVWAGGTEIDPLFNPFANTLTSLTSLARDIAPGLDPLVTHFTVLPLLLCSLTAILVLLFERGGYLAGIKLSRFLDRMTWYHLRQSAFGNDTSGELGIAASDKAPWINESRATLPDQIGTELSEYANRAAAQAVAKLRTAIQVLAFSEERESRSDLIADYLTWDELIHTAYFKVPRFRKLVCYAIAHSPGFKPSEMFKTDPDYVLMGAWYEDVRSRPIRK
jgi:hypothetical protein